MPPGLEIPGQTRIGYFHHREHDIAGNITTQLNTPNGPEVHTAGGYTRLEAAALEIAKAAAEGAADSEQVVDAAEVGRWAARAAAAMLAECEVIQSPSAVRSALEA
jgi:hypothetical protein